MIYTPNSTDGTYREKGSYTCNQLTPNNEKFRSFSHLLATSDNDEEICYNQFRVIVAGGRNFQDEVLMRNKLDFYLDEVSKTHEIRIVCGKARGADILGAQYALDHNYAVDMYPADWNKFGKSAGYKRNVIMANNADALVAFWDSESLGTKHMIDVAKAKGLDIRVVYYD